tara:strand:- start:1315 stop:1932 length:618 start_codon:yes stop_codon:yes gene_type:complete
MARLLTDGSNIDPATTDYPNGRTRDKAGAIAGTTINEVLTGDKEQFFQKLLITAGITANGNPDNVANGYQLIEALLKNISLSNLRASNETVVTSPITSSVGDVITFVPDATNDWDDLKITFSSSVTPTGTSTTALTTTFAISVNGVVKNTLAFNVSDENRGHVVHLMASGIAYTAGDIVKVTGITSSLAANIGANSILIVEGKNN